MDWILVLAIGTFVLLILFLLWNRSSTKRHHEMGSAAEGVGGKGDPLSGNTDGMRDPVELRRDLNTAAASDERPTLHGKPE